MSTNARSIRPGKRFVRTTVASTHASSTVSFLVSSSIGEGSVIALAKALATTLPGFLGDIDITQEVVRVIIDITPWGHCYGNYNQL